MQIKRFTEYYYPTIRVIFVVLLALAIAINILDLFTYAPAEHTIPINITTIILLMGFSTLHFIYKTPLPISFAACIYVIIINILLSQYFSDRSNELDLLNLFRETVFFILMMVFSGIFIHKSHTVIILLILLARYLHANATLDMEFLSTHLPVFLFTFAAIATVVYFFADILHKSTEELQKKQLRIAEANEELKTNTEELKATLDDLSKKNERLQDLNLSKDKFFTIITHDLKNPLSTLQGFVELLIRKGEELAKEKRELYLTHVQASVKSIQGLLDGLLEWSRSQSNRVKMEPATVKLHGLIESVNDFLGVRAADKKIQLVNLSLPEHKVFADYNMVFTVLRNLISNGIKYSYPEQKVTITSEEKNELILVRVVDEGIGMDERELSKLFKIESPTSTPGTHDEPGAGLGLLLCAEYIRKNGGSIHVNSSPESGSNFWFTLPKDQS